MSKHALSRPGGKFLQFLRRALQEICKSGAGLLENDASGKLLVGGKVAGLQAAWRSRLAPRRKSRRSRGGRCESELILLAWHGMAWHSIALHSIARRRILRDQQDGSDDGPPKIIRQEDRRLAAALA